MSNLGCSIVKYFSKVCLVAPPQVEGARKQTALHLSVNCRALSAIHILVSHGADINAVDSSGMTALHMAAGILHKDIIASLIREGADINMVRVVSCAAGFFCFVFFWLHFFLLHKCHNETPKTITEVIHNFIITNFHSLPGQLNRTTMLLLIWK